MSESTTDQGIEETDAAQPGEPEDDSGNSDGDTAGTGTSGTTGRRRRVERLFPSMSFLEARALAEAIQEHGAGQPIKRLTLFESWGKSPDSGPTRRLITSSNQYKLTTGGYRAETLALTPQGKISSNPTAPEAERLRASFALAIKDIAPFNYIYEKYVGSRLPTVEVLRDAAREAGVPDEHVAECVETFLANARDLGLIRNIGGSEHLVSLDTALDAIARRTGEATPPPPPGPSAMQQFSVSNPGGTSDGGGVSLEEDLSNVCFVISPIGDEDSEHRRHADLVLGSLIEPALVELKLGAVRADQISKPGLITGQVIDHLVRAKLVIADLSFGNPNVFYELALRHATRLPVVQIIRKGDKLPFDVGQYRTVELDMTDIYTLVPKIDLYRQEITRQSRVAVNEGVAAESPLSQFYPKFWEHLGR